METIHWSDSIFPLTQLDKRVMMAIRGTNPEHYPSGLCVQLWDHLG